LLVQLFVFVATPYPWPHGHRVTQIVSRDA
jgi:hypothetical protein